MTWLVKVLLQRRLSFLHEMIEMNEMIQMNKMNETKVFHFESGCYLFEVVDFLK